MAGRYMVQRLLGRGGAKEVWLAHDLALDRPVALARVHGGADARQRLRHEARLTARLGGHRHIVTVHDVFEHDGAPWLVARYMSGGSLADRLARAPGGRLGLDEALRTAREVADALAHAHAQGIVHRDVKPDNVWLDAEGEAALGDFGVASAPELGAPEAMPVGTPLYMAPEQAAGRPATPRGDVYGLGATLQELLAGDRRAPLPADVPAPVAELLSSLLAADPAQRPPDAAAARDALDAVAGGPGRAAPPEAARLVGRGAELERLRAALARAWAGTASTVIVEGEAGIGKTALIDALAAEARLAGGLAVWGRAEPEGVAYGPWRPVVRALAAAADADDVPPVVERLRGGGAATEAAGEDARLQLFDGVADLLGAVAARAPVQLVLDDLHWADASSLRLLAHVAAAQRDAPLLLVGGVRPGEPEDPLAVLHGDPRVERLRLAGLAAGDVGRLLPDAANEELVAAVHARTGGNPFYVSELVRLLEAEGRLEPGAVPARVREVVRRRLDRLGPETHGVLEVAAVAGGFTLAALARAGGSAPALVADALDPALAAGVVVETEPGRYGFAHAIVRDAVYDGLPARRRGELHGAVLGALEAGRDAGADVSDAELAHHALAAARAGGDPQPAFRAAVAAAREAAAALGHAEAAAHYAAALEALELGASAPADERHAVLLALADATFAAGDIEAGRRRYAQAAGVARRAGAAELLVRAALGFAQVQPYGVVDEDAVRLLAEALAALPAGDDPLRARAAGLLAARLEPAHDQERREALIDEALAMARRLGDEATLVWLQSFAVMVEWRPERADRRRAAAAEVVRHGDQGPLLWAHVQRIRDALQEGDVAAADAELDRARPVAVRLRRSYHRWYVLVVEAARAAFAGRLADAERLGEEALEINRRHGEDCEQEHTVHRLVLAKLAWRPHEFDPRLLRGYAGRYRLLPVWEAMLALAEWDLGRPEAARRSLDACGDFSAVLRTADHLAALACLGEAAAGAGTPEQVRRLYALLEPHAAANPVVDAVWAAWGPVARPLALLAAADDRPHDAAAHFAHALRLARQWRAPAWALRVIGDWLATGVPCPDRAALAAEGFGLARELELTRAAAKIADDAASPGGRCSGEFDQRLSGS
ncbi:MAG TPA: AAA family ATPase [Solirubrobacteraceae bacterium]